MYVRRDIRWRFLIRFAWRHGVVFAIWSGLAVLNYQLAAGYGINASIPFSPIGTIGIAVALYVGFKNNQSYDRSWEARKIWGGIVNVSRTFAAAVCGYVSQELPDAASDASECSQYRRQLLYRHIAWTRLLVLHLRRPNYFTRQHVSIASILADSNRRQTAKEAVQGLLSEEETEHILAANNSPVQVLHRQAEQLRLLVEQDRVLNHFRHVDLMRLLEQCYEFQGKCERIKNTPFPRQYAYFSTVFTWVFILLLPFGLLSEFAAVHQDLVWLTIPFHVLISWIFMTMELVGDYSEDPFENLITDVPMTALCRAIEIDLRQMLGERDIPEPLRPVNDVLM